MKRNNTFSHDYPQIIRSISPIMIKNKYGRILNVSSIFSTISKEKRVIYSATKSGLNGIKSHPCQN